MLYFTLFERVIILTHYFIKNYENPMNDIKVNLGEDQPLYQYIKKAIQDIIIMKGEEGKFRLSVKQTFILHKVLEEIDWLDDDTDTTFIQWYDDVYKWPWKTRNFKAVLSPFKNTPSASWNENTVKDANTGREYRDFANYVRNLFVEIDANGKITDKQEFLKLGSDGKPMYIGHDLRGNL